MWPEGKDQILRFEHSDAEGEEEDSLYDILTGRTPVPRIREDMNMDMEEEDDGEAMLDDTFREKRGRANSEVRGRGLLDESGMDEMF